jgi:hypothetical protein
MGTVVTTVPMGPPALAPAREILRTGPAWGVPTCSVNAAVIGAPSCSTGDEMVN